jgi:hypothetical protein
MATSDEPSPQSDLEEVCRLIAAGKKVTGPELLKRIHQRSEQATRQVHSADITANGWQELG